MKKRPHVDTQTVYRVKTTLTPEAMKAIDDVHDAAIEVLSRTRFTMRNVCQSNLAGLFDYARQLEDKLAVLRKMTKLLHEEKVPVKRVRTTYLEKRS